MNVNKIGLLLINCINNNNNVNKNIFIKNINEYRDYKETLHNKYLDDLSYYISNYENKRIKNNNLYNEYLQKRFNLYKQWLDNKNIGNLHNLISLERPELEEIPNIYTKKRLLSKLK